MFIGKNQRTRLMRFIVIFTVALLVASCGGGSTSSNVVEQYYAAIENGDADAAAALFAEDAVITTPSGSVLTGIDAITGRFIPFDLQYMDRVEFFTDFTEVDGRISWSQTYYEKSGNSFNSTCVVTLENGKIVDWYFR